MDWTVFGWHSQPSQPSTSKLKQALSESGGHYIVLLCFYCFMVYAKRIFSHEKIKTWMKSNEKGLAVLSSVGNTGVKMAVCIIILWSKLHCDYSIKFSSIQFNPIQFNFVYITTNHNKSYLVILPYWAGLECTLYRDSVLLGIHTGNVSATEIMRSCDKQCTK